MIVQFAVCAKRYANNSIEEVKSPNAAPILILATWKGVALVDTQLAKTFRCVASECIQRIGFPSSVVNTSAR